MNTSEDAGGERETYVLSCRVSKNFRELVKEFCRLDMHLNPGDLLRDAIREKIQREAPDLYKKVFLEVSQE